MVGLQTKKTVKCDIKCTTVMFILSGYDDEETKTVSHGNKKSNILPLWGNERTMNLNALILTNIQSSHYFKGNI